MARGARGVGVDGEQPASGAWSSREWAQIRPRGRGACSSALQQRHGHAREASQH